jgi:hypothetical protein
MSLPKLLLITLSIALAGRSAGAVTLHVATHGNDANPGTEAKSFASIERARDEIRRLKAAGPLPSGGIVVEIRGGVYQMRRAVEFSKEDSGSNGSPIVYQARRGEAVRLVGGRVVTGWQRVADPKLLGRLEGSARGNVWQADLRALGITDFGGGGSGRPATGAFPSGPTDDTGPLAE